VLLPNSLRFDGGFLIGRVLAFSVLIIITEQADSPFLLMVALLAAGLTMVSLATRQTWLLPYGFLAATALWAGAAAMVIVDQAGGLSLLFAVIMAFLDASTFVVMRATDQS
jgi:hypothetical protein